MSSLEIQTLMQQLADVKNKMKSISEKPLCELLNEIQGRIDWLLISSVYMDGFRSPEECENMWNNVLEYSINKEAFTKEEDGKLLCLAEGYNERDWDLIADSLKTNRTAIQCFVRYQRKLNKKRRHWSREEDERLLAIISELKHGEFIPWDKVSKLMEDRTRLQCKYRYKIITLAYTSVPWTPEEYAILIACYDKFGPKWTNIGPFFKRRTLWAIRSRYVLTLDPFLKFGSWTVDEDKHLISLIRKYGYGKWAKVSKEMSGRSNFMCMRRADLLLKHSIEFHSDQGTEYDPDIYDPELFARILKPFGSNIFSNYTNRSIRENAIAVLLKAIKKVLPDVRIQIDDVTSTNFSWLSIEQLHQISEELHSMFLEREELEPPVVFLRNYSTDPWYRKRYVEETSDDDDDDDDINDTVDEIQEFPPEISKWLYSVLTIFIKMQSKIMHPPFKRRPQALYEENLAEISLYKSFLYKEFNCLSICDEGDDVENRLFSNIEYSATLFTAVNKFIQPPLCDNQFIVLAPNLTTICGLEVAEITENRLIDMSEFVFHSKDYINFLHGRRKSCPKCLQCLSRINGEKMVQSSENNPNKASFEDMTCHMVKKHFIVNELMESSAHIEVASKEKCVETCSCDSLKASMKSVQLLKKRFIALFLWPVLLSTANFTDEQDELLCKERKASDIDYFPKDERRISLNKRKTAKKRKGKTASRLKTQTEQKCKKRTV